MKLGVYYFAESGVLFELDEWRGNYYIYECNNEAQWYFQISQIKELKLYIDECKYLGEL